MTLAVFLFSAACVAWSWYSIRETVLERRREAAEQRRDAERRRRDQFRRASVEKPREAAPSLALEAFRKRKPVAGLANASELFVATNLWTVHLRFTPEQWAGIEPRYIEPLNRGEGGRFGLRNPAAKRSGLSGVRGLEFDWVHGTVEFEDRTFADVAIRYKGNGTYMRSQHMTKRPFKVDLNKYVKGVELAGRTTFNFANLVSDDSCMHDAMAYEFFRAMGVPAPRTAYARLFLSNGAMQSEYLGLYAIVENLDDDFAGVRFGTRKGVFFKPVTPDLFADLGDDWAEYEPIYDPKSKPTEAQKRRVIDFARLLTHADAPTFASRVGEFIDLDEFARFLAGMVLLSSYDGFLNNGQNFYLWLDADAQRFQFIPWDLDNAWGKYGWAGPASDRANASIRHPWMRRHALLERILEVPEFRDRYLAELGKALDTLFIPERLHRRVDELAALLRPVVAEDSQRKAPRFEQAVTATAPVEAYQDSPEFGRNRPPHPLKWFITERAASVRAQLRGESEGIVLERWR
jgi:spore coat protein H